VNQSSLTVQALMNKATRSCASARALLGLGDGDGAANRAYYAMFDAARAVLLASGGSVATTGRTHSGLIAAFGQYLVKHAAVSKDLGRFLNRAHEIRLIADYNGDSVELNDAEAIVAQAETFIAAMQSIATSPSI